MYDEDAIGYYSQLEFIGDTITRSIYLGNSHALYSYMHDIADGTLWAGSPVKLTEDFFK